MSWPGGQAGGDDRADAAGGTGDEDAHRAQILGTTAPSSPPIRWPRPGPAASTSSWLSGSPVIPAARLVTSEMPSTSMPASRAAIASSVVDMPTRSPPIAPDHPDLGRRLVVRPGELHVDALVEAGLDLPAQRAQPGRVEVGQVDEVRAVDRASAGEVDVVADQHRRAGRPAPVEPAAAVGQHDDPAAGRGRGPHAVHDRGDAAALVEVGAAEEDQQACGRPPHPDRADLAGVALRRPAARSRAGRWWRSRPRPRRAGPTAGQPAGAQHQGDVVALDAGQLGEPGGRRGGELVRRAGGAAWSRGTLADLSPASTVLRVRSSGRARRRSAGDVVVGRAGRPRRRRRACPR